MIHIDPIMETSPHQDHCINITCQPDGIHVSMTDNVDKVIKYPNGDIKVIGKQDTESRPFWMLTGYDGYASMFNKFTDEREGFNTAWAWEEAAKAAGIPIQEEAKRESKLEAVISDILGDHPEHNTHQEHDAVLAKIMQAIQADRDHLTTQEGQ